MASTSHDSAAGFVKCDSTNLPRICFWDILEYMNNSDKHNPAEVRGAKALTSSRDTYVDNAIGYVEIKRTISGDCHVRAKITPEHNIRKKLYVVTAIINEKEGVIQDSKCEGCAASSGGCKHALVLLYWLEKQSSKPSCTSVECYWRKPSLTSAADQVVESKQIYSSSVNIILDPPDQSILENFKTQCEYRKCTSSLLYLHLSENNLNKPNNYSVFNLMLRFYETEQIHTFEKFKEYCNIVIKNNVVRAIEKITQSQSNSKLWHSIRQGRITASKLYELSTCRVTNGSLVQQVLGGYKVPQTKAIKRGKKLEKFVVKKIEKVLKVNINNAGFVLVDGIVGASPDGITDDFVVEIKCPMTKKSLLQYIKNGVVNKKFYAQIQLQMLATKKQKGLFCIADPDFERNEKVMLIWVDFDFNYVMTILSEAERFWKDNIFPKIFNSVL